MAVKQIEDLVWYHDNAAIHRREPGICHSYLASVATVLEHVSDDFDPVWLMGAGGFAFRIMLHETLCPSAMSVFDFRRILPEVVEQAGYRCTHIHRLWDEGDKEEERRVQARGAIIDSIDRGVPAVVWDIADAEWGLIVGYDTESECYRTLTCEGTPSELPFDRLGHNGIDILSVILLGEPNGRNRREIIRSALETAVDHAGQNEWTERPKYANGLAAFTMWRQVYDRWAKIAADGDPAKIGLDICHRARYYAGHYYGARSYAREFLISIAGKDVALNQAAAGYGTVAERLEPVWLMSPRSPDANPRILKELAIAVREAGEAEQEAVEFLRESLLNQIAAAKRPSRLGRES